MGLLIKTPAKATQGEGYRFLHVQLEESDFMSSLRNAPAFCLVVGVS